MATQFVEHVEQFLLGEFFLADEGGHDVAVGAAVVAVDEVGGLQAAVVGLVGVVIAVFVTDAVKQCRESIDIQPVVA